jgi:hypothetical protein
MPQKGKEPSVPVAGLPAPTAFLRALSASTLTSFPRVLPTATFGVATFTSNLLARFLVESSILEFSENTFASHHLLKLRNGTIEVVSVNFYFEWT